MDCVLHKCLDASVPPASRYPFPPCYAEEGDSRVSVENMNINDWLNLMTPTYTIYDWAAENGWTDIKRREGVWMGFSPGSLIEEFIPIHAIRELCPMDMVMEFDYVAMSLQVAVMQLRLAASEGITSQASQEDFQAWCDLPTTKERYAEDLGKISDWKFRYAAMVWRMHQYVA